jgi:hypothetical protein
MPADAVNDQEDPASWIDVEPVLVLEALQSRMRVAGRTKGAVWIAHH